MAKTDVMVWIDLETTGLEAYDGDILEFGAILTSADLETELETYSRVVSTPNARMTLAGAVDLVRDMHQKNGLWDEVMFPGEDGGDTVDYMTLTDEFTALIKKWESKYSFEAKSEPVCGNSVRLDREFMRENIGGVDALFHYRIIDVSTIKELARKAGKEHTDEEIWGADIVAAGKQHRVLADLRASIAELKFYRGMGYVV